VATRGSLEGYGPGSLPAAEWSTAQKPALVDRDADYNIPRLWCARDVYGKPTAIFRALTDGERSVVCRRRDELSFGCAPFAPGEEDRAIAAMAAMLNGFRSMARHDDDVAVAGLDGLRRVLAPFPLWAIEQGCLAIQGGTATLDGEKLSKKYPPNDSEIRGVIAEIVKPYAEKRDAAMALLAAPVEARAPEEPKPTRAELEEKYGPNLGLEGSATTPVFVDTQAPGWDKVAAAYTPEDLERLASQLQRGAA
jgi:hypothetical protein